MSDFTPQQLAALHANSNAVKNAADTEVSVARAFGDEIVETRRTESLYTDFFGNSYVATLLLEPYEVYRSRKSREEV